MIKKTNYNVNGFLSWNPWEGIESIILNELSIKPLSTGELLKNQSLREYPSKDIRYAMHSLLSYGKIELARSGKLKIFNIPEVEDID